MRRLSILVFTGLLLSLSSLAAACSGSDDEYITVYAGRSSALVGPLLSDFVKETGIKIRVRYGDGTDLALGILEEGNKGPADVYYGQDVGALGALKAENRLAKLPDELLNLVPASFRSPEGLWVGTSGRSRVIVYNTDDIDPKTLPSTILDYTNPQWNGRVGFVPRSDGFPEFVTALRLTRGEAFARNWLTSLKSNNAKAYPNNLIALQAVANNEIDVAFLNHYYLYRFLAERGPNFKARNYYFDNGDLGGLFLVAGVAVLNSSKKKENANRFVEYMLSKKAQEYFAAKDYEYPLLKGVDASSDLPPISTLKAPDMDLSNLGDLKGSLEMMRQAGILP